MKTKKENSSMNINVSTKDLAIKTKRTFRGIASIALTSALAITGVVGISSPASAEVVDLNNPQTFLDEGFHDEKGYFIDNTGADEVFLAGVVSSSDPQTRKVALTIEDGNLFARAYVATSAVTSVSNSSVVPNYSQVSQYDYGLDVSFDTDGILDTGISDVTAVLAPQIMSHLTTLNLKSNVPRMLVSTETGGDKTHTYLAFDNVSLSVCDLPTEGTCPNSASTQDLTAAIEAVGGEGVTPTGFSAYSDSIVFVSGLTVTAGLTGDPDGNPVSGNVPFIAKIDLGRAAPDDVAEFVYIGDSDLPPGYQSADGFSFHPVGNGLEAYSFIHLMFAGNLEHSDGSSVGFVLRRDISGGGDLSPSNYDGDPPYNLIEFSSANTHLDFANHEAAGGWFSEGSREKPFRVANRDSTASFNDFAPIGLDTDSSANETLLSANTNGPRGTRALATDGGNLRVYSWNSQSSPETPTYSSIEAFGDVSGTLSSAQAIDAEDLVFAAFSSPSASKIVISRFQTRPVIPQVTNDFVLKISGDFLYRSATPQTELLVGNPEFTYFTCDSSFAGSSKTVSTPAVPSGCTEISGLDSVSTSNGQVSVTNINNDPLLSGNIVLRHTWSNPDFVYWTNSVFRQASGPTPPSITSVTPLRGGAQVNFNPGDTPGIASFKVEASAVGYDLKTATGTSSPITVDGLEDGVTYSFSLTAFDSNGVFAAADNSPESSPTLSPGSADGNFFITPSVSVNEVAETVLAPSGNIYVISADVRRYLPNGDPHTGFGDNGVADLPSSGPAVLDVVEADDGLLVLIDDAGTKKIVVYNDDGTVNTAVGTSGVLTPTPPSAPANPLDPKIDFTGTTIGDGSAVGVEIPGVELPGNLNVTASAVMTVDLNGSPANYVLGETTDGPSGSGFLISRIIDDGGPVIDGTFGEGPILIDNPSGTPEAGGVTVDDEGNVYVLVKVNDEVIIVAIDPDGNLITNFGDEGILTIAGADSPGSIEFKDNRLVVSSKTASATVLSAFLTPAGFDALPLAVGSSGNQQQSSPGGAAYSAPSPFAGPVVTGVTEGGIAAAAGGNVRIQGEKLESVSEAKIGELEVEVVSATANGLELKLPEGLEAGVYALTLTTAQGLVTIEDAIRVSASNAPTFRGDGQWTKAQTNAEGTVQSVKMYAKDPIGIGKMQFVVNGQEIAWIRAEDETDPKLREAVTGDNYLVRTIDLVPGKNALEIYIEGERVWRAAYTLR